MHLKPLTVQTSFEPKARSLLDEHDTCPETMRHAESEVPCDYRLPLQGRRRPYMQDYDVGARATDRCCSTRCVRIKVDGRHPALRRSCREGVCGSDAMNINGKNGLACITQLADLKEPVVTAAAARAAGDPRPDRGHDAVLQAVPLDQALPGQQRRRRRRSERLQSPEEREELDGLYECILCACCSTACPSFWWNPDKFVGPAGLLQAYRFIADTRDQATSERLDDLEDPYRLFRCHSIMNCVDVCPKGLNPTRAIGKIKELMVRSAPCKSEGSDDGDRRGIRWRCRAGCWNSTWCCTVPRAAAGTEPRRRFRGQGACRGDLRIPCCRRGATSGDGEARRDADPAAEQGDWCRLTSALTAALHQRTTYGPHLWRTTQANPHPTCDGTRS